MVLVLLPGHPPYYTAAASIVAKIYSNSMMAMLNSRVKPVSNALAIAAPYWNESAQPIGSFSAIEGVRGIVFRRGSESGPQEMCVACACMRVRARAVHGTHRQIICLHVDTLLGVLSADSCD